jgi:hypothetical protein
MIFFSVGFQSVLVNLEARLQESEASVGQRRAAECVGAEATPPVAGATTAYADDSWLAGEPEVLVRVIPHIGPECAKVGLEYSPSKSALVGLKLDLVQQDELPEEFTVHTDGTVMLGCPVGTEEFQREQLRQIIQQALPPREALNKLRKKTAYLLLARCMNARPNYLASACSLKFAQDALREFDAAVDTVIADILGIREADLPYLAVLRGLPQQHGGLGLRRYWGPDSERLALITRKRTEDFMRASPRLMALLGSRTNNTQWSPIVIGESVGLARENGLEAPTTDEQSEGELRKVWTEATNKVHAANFRVQVRENQDWSGNNRDRRLQGLALLESGSVKGGAQWMVASHRPGSQGAMWGRASDKAFPAAALVRLGLLPTASAGNSAMFRCLHCVGMGQRSCENSSTLEIHALHCPLNEKLTKHLHDQVRNRVASSLKRILPSPDTVVEVEKDIGADGNRKHVDIRVVTRLANGQEKVWNLDTTVVNPCCYVTSADHLVGGDGPTDRPAARAAEMRKKLAYRSLVTPQDYVSMVPLVVEVTGRLGPAFEEFLRELGEICGIRDRPAGGAGIVQRSLYKNKAAVELTSLRYDLSSLVARFNGYKILALRDRQRVLEVAPPRR